MCKDILRVVSVSQGGNSSPEESPNIKVLIVTWSQVKLTIVKRDVNQVEFDPVEGTA